MIQNTIYNPLCSMQIQGISKALNFLTGSENKASFVLQASQLDADALNYRSWTRSNLFVSQLCRCLFLYKVILYLLTSNVNELHGLDVVTALGTTRFI